MSGALREISDKDLVIAYKAGTTGAYEEIYRRHSDRVRAICRRMLGNKLDAEEAAQETFLRSYQALHRFNGQYQLGAWLARIASNICVDEIRHRNRTVETYEASDTLAQTESPLAGTEVLVTEQIRLAEALNEITPLHAEALMMRAVQGMSHVEISDRLEMSPQQVKSLLHRARTSFRRAWQEASGFVMAPIVWMRAMAGRSKDPTSFHSLAAATPMTAITMERVATSAVAVVLAISGISATSSSSSTWSTDDVNVSPRAAALPPRETDFNLTGATPEAPSHEHAGLLDAVDELVQTVTVEVHDETKPNEPTEPEDPVGNPSTTASDRIEETHETVQRKVTELGKAPLAP